MIWKNSKVLILVVVFILALIIIGAKGLQYGLDFSGGTQFILTLNEEVKDSATMDKINEIIAKRMDWSGLKDVKVNSWDNRFISVQIAESDPQRVALIEELLQKQGKFECVFEGKVLFNGDSVTVNKSADKGFGIVENKETKQAEWNVPFTLTPKDGKNFSEGIFHKCISTPTAGAICPSTYFFIDRPLSSLVLIPKEIYDADSLDSATYGDQFNEVMKNSNVNYIVFETLDENTLSTIKEKLNTLNLSKIVYPGTLDITILKDKNLDVEYIEVPKTTDPWVKTAIGLKSMIYINENITNKNVASINAPNFVTYTNLSIQGTAENMQAGQKEVNELSAILSSGSLPVGIENISKETISPLMGQNILSKIAIMGLLALLVVAIIIFVRYHDWRIAIPIFVTGALEIFLTIAFASLINWQLDLAAFAGILTAVGTGVNDQIIITDELERNKGKDDQEERSLLARVKRAFFIIWMAAATITATMLPIIFVFGGVPKLVGFALTTLIGVAIGVFITRPAFAAIIKEIINN